MAWFWRIIAWLSGRPRSESRHWFSKTFDLKQDFDGYVYNDLMQKVIDGKVRIMNRHVANNGHVHLEWECVSGGKS